MTDRRQPKDHPIRDLLTFWDTEYQRQMGSRYPFNGGKDAKLVQGLREMYSDDDIKTFMAAFFEIDDDFIEQSGKSLGVFRGCLPKVIQFIRHGQRGETPKNLKGVQQWISKRASGG